MTTKEIILADIENNGIKEGSDCYNLVKKLLTKKEKEFLKLKSKLKKLS